MLDAWRRDVADVGQKASPEPRFTTTGSACFCSLSLARHREFLEVWHRLQMTVLPEKNVGVVDLSPQFYPQLDESTQNACLAFWPGAPRPQDTFKMNKERSRLFVHFTVAALANFHLLPTTSKVSPYGRRSSRSSPDTASPKFPRANVPREPPFSAPPTAAFAIA